MLKPLLSISTVIVFMTLINLPAHALIPTHQAEITQQAHQPIPLAMRHNNLPTTLQVDHQTTDSVTQTNVKLIPTSPGIAMNNLYASQEHAHHLLTQQHIDKLRPLQAPIHRPRLLQPN